MAAVYIFYNFSGSIENNFKQLLSQINYKINIFLSKNAFIYKNFYFICSQWNFSFNYFQIDELHFQLFDFLIITVSEVYRQSRKMHSQTHDDSPQNMKAVVINVSHCAHYLHDFAWITAAMKYNTIMMNILTQFLQSK